MQLCFGFGQSGIPVAKKALGGAPLAAAKSTVSPVRLFLLRDSQSNPRAFVLTLCHHQKIKHFQILPVSLLRRRASVGLMQNSRHSHLFMNCFVSLNLVNFSFQSKFERQMKLSVQRFFRFPDQGLTTLPPTGLAYTSQPCLHSLCFIHSTCS